MHFRGQRAANPLHRFLSQFVERDYHQFEMLLLRVLAFVVTDAVQPLHKHHVGGNARARPLQHRGADRKENDTGVAPVSANRLIGQSGKTS